MFRSPVHPAVLPPENSKLGLTSRFSPVSPDTESVTGSVRGLLDAFVSETVIEALWTP